MSGTLSQEWERGKDRYGAHPGPILHRRRRAVAVDNSVMIARIILLIPVKSVCLTV